MLDLIEMELTRVRRMAERADDGLLLYLIDMAIIEAHARSRFHRDSSGTIGSGTPDRDHLRLAPETRRDLQIVD
jgi:hypothetical protein